jgi:ribokinase
MVVKAEHLPAPGETVLGGTFMMNAGGKGANQAVAATRLGGKVSFVANLGNDLFGMQALDQFKQESINTEFISLDEFLPSGVALINVDAKGENCITVAPGANGNLTHKQLLSFFDSINPEGFVLVQLEIPLSTVEYIIEQCALRNIPVIVNPAPAAKLKNDTWKHVFAITPNESEATLLTGVNIKDDRSVKEAASILHRMGVKNVIITLGKRGAYWSDLVMEGWIASPEVTAVDTTAAGDCFSGALTVALSENKSLNEAVRFACIAASISVTRMGAQASMPTRSEVENFLNSTT